MDADLIPVIDALGELSDTELHALIDATNKVTQIAPGLLAWIEHAADWEIRRRERHEFPLKRPDAAIPPEEEGMSVDALVSLRQAFPDASRPIGALFEAVISLLGRAQRLH